MSRPSTLPSTIHRRIHLHVQVTRAVIIRPLVHLWLQVHAAYQEAQPSIMSGAALLQQVAASVQQRMQQQQQASSSGSDGVVLMESDTDTQLDRMVAECVQDVPQALGKLGRWVL